MNALFKLTVCCLGFAVGALLTSTTVGHSSRQLLDSFQVETNSAVSNQQHQEQEKEIQKLAKTLSEYESQILKLQAERSKNPALNELDEARKEIVSLKEKLQDYEFNKQERKQLAAELKATKAEAKKFESDVEHYKSLLTDTTSSKEHEYAKLKSNLDVALDDNSELLSTLKNLRAKHEKLSSEYSEARKKLKSLSTVSKDNIRLQNEIRTIREQDKNSKSDANRIQGQLEALQRELEKMHPDLANYRQKATTLERQISALNAEVAQFEQQVRVLRASEQGLKQEKATLSKRNTKLELELTKNSSQLKTMRTSKDSDKLAINQLELKVASLKKELQDINSDSSRLQQNNKELKIKVDELKQKENFLEKSKKELEAEVARLTSENESAANNAAKLDRLEKELVKTKSALLIKETELKHMTRHQSTPERNIIVPPTRTQPLAPSSEVLVAEVTKPKVNLRTGPGTEHSALMQVKQGARLTVESKQGDWYRVLTPTGSRAYVRSDVIRILSSNSSNSASNNQMEAFGSIPQKPVKRTPRRMSEDEKAFNALKKNIGKGR